MINYSELKRNREKMQYHEFSSTSATSRDRTLRAYYWEQAATSDSREVQGTDLQIDIYKVFFQGRNIVRLLKQETIESMELEIKENNSVHI